jgi:hypothetical protein
MLLRLTLFILRLKTTNISVFGQNAELLNVKEKDAFSHLKH